MDYIDHFNSPVGGLTIISDGTGITGIFFSDTKPHFNPDGFVNAGLPVFEQTKKWLDIYFGGSEPDFTPPVHLNTTLFGKAVYNALMRVPYGETTTYLSIAEKAAKTTGKSGISARAAGAVLKSNPVLLLIPCHRVIGSDGKLKGYSGGEERKKMLLDIEKNRPKCY